MQNITRKWISGTGDEVQKVFQITHFDFDNREIGWIYDNIRTSRSWYFDFQKVEKYNYEYVRIHCYASSSNSFAKDPYVGHIYITLIAPGKIQVEFEMRESRIKYNVVFA